MKYPLLAGAVLIGAGIVAPKIIGSQVESEIQMQVAAFDALPMYGAKLSNVQNGWFGMTAELAVTLDFAEGMNLNDAETAAALEKIEAVFDINTQHGPVLLGDSLQFGLVSWQATLREDALRDHIEWAEGQTFLQHTGFMNLIGNVTYDDTMAAFKILDEGFDFEVGAYMGSGTYSGQKLAYEGELGEVKGSGASGPKLSMQPMTMTMQMQGSIEEVLSGNLYNSTFEFLMPGVGVGSEANPLMRMTGLSFGGKSAVSEDKTQGDIDLYYKIAELVVPDYTLSDTVIAMQVQRLSNAFMKALNTLNVEIAKADDPQTYVETFAREQLLPQLMLEPTFNLTDVSFSMPAGTFKGKFNSAIKGVTALPDTLEDQAFWLQHLVADGTASADKALITFLAEQSMKGQLMQNPQTAGMSEAEILDIAKQQAPVMVDNFMQQGLLVENGETYKTEFSLTDGKAVLNGQEIPLPVGE